MSDDVRTDLMQTGPRPAGAFASYRLVVVEGVDLHASVVVDGSSPSRILVGQSSACELQLHDRGVSRRHAAFDLHPLGLKLTDLGSTNGTTVNGILVGDATLRGGEIVRLASTAIRVERAEDVAVELSPSAGFGRVIGASVAMKRLYPLCERLALSDLPVVIEGETGAGKELMAEALHEAGPRRSKPFVVFDCTSVPHDDVLTVLFGDGAPLGSSSFEQAEGGTLLIDEVAELGDDAQARLLRVLDRSELRRSASGVVVRVDVRVLAATRRDLDQAVQEGRFREDLFFRLAVGRIELPPLRDRHGDVSLLAQTFWRRMAGAQRPLPPDFLNRFERHRWPGNVRELQNAVARRLALGAFDAEPEARLQAAPEDPFARVLGLDLPLAEARARLVDEFERQYVAKVLEQHGGSVSRAAAASGIARRYFQILRARHGK